MFKSIIKKTGDWLYRKAVNGAKSDLENFIMILRGSPDETAAITLAMASVQRISLQKRGIIPAGILESGHHVMTAESARASDKLKFIIKELNNRGMPMIAAGVQVWYHSLRALNLPEISYLGQQLWHELERGRVNAAEQLKWIPLPNNVTMEEAEKAILFVPPILSKVYSNDRRPING